MLLFINPFTLSVDYCVATFIERKMRWYMGILISDRSALSMEEVIKKLYRALPVGTFQTATTDRGKEFSCYDVIEKELKILFYFSDTYSSWQRGGNENVNGLLKIKCENNLNTLLKRWCF